MNSVVLNSCGAGFLFSSLNPGINCSLEFVTTLLDVLCKFVVLLPDHGVEFFGGNVFAKHLIVTGVGDDSLDWTDGWQGGAQFVILHQHDDNGDNGIEADNNAENNEAAPRSNPML